MTRDFRSDGRLSIGSTGHKNLYIALGLGGSGLDAKGGIVGGNIEIANINTYSKLLFINCWLDNCNFKRIDYACR